MYTVYGIKYKVQGGIVYIGQTEGDIKERFGRHIIGAYSKLAGTKLSRLIRVSNIDDFELITLESNIPTLSEAHEREKYYINATQKK